MVKVNLIYVFSVYIYLSILVLESHSKIPSRNRGCPPIQLNNGRVKLRSGGRVARITCNRLFKLVQGSEFMTCVRGEWDIELPICARTGCSDILDNIPHGKLILVDEAKLEIECDPGFAIDGLSFTYCNESIKWNDELKGCKENDRFYLTCDFESSDGRFCGWQNDRFNDVDWLADKMSFAFYPSRRHVIPGSSQYFTNNYVSLDAGNYGYSTFGKLISPLIPPVESKQRCLIFSYKVISGTSHGAHTLTVTFGNIPHWTTSEGEGRVIIGLYNFNISSQIIIEGKSCKAAIDNIIVTEGYSCSQKPYEDESDTCLDNCGKISYDNSCSCDWECHFNDNCCSDIRRKCPYIKPLEEIKRLYLTTETPITVKTTKHTFNVTTSTISTISLKITNESIKSNDSITVSTPMNENNVTVSKITNTFTQNTNTSQMYSLYHTKTTEKPMNIPILNQTLIFNSSSFYHTTDPSSILTTTRYLDKITNITTTPKLHLVTANVLVKNTTTVGMISVKNFNSTIKPSVTNTTYTSRVLNTTNMTIKSLMGNQFSYTNLINMINSTTIPTTIFSTKKINSSNNTTITTKSVNVTTTNHEREKSINTINFTFEPLMNTTSDKIVVPNITTESFIKNSNISTKPSTFSSTMKIFPPIRKLNESNSLKPLYTTFTTKSLNILNVSHKDITTESKITINNFPNYVSNTNNYTTPNEDMINFDFNQSHSNLSRFFYEITTQPFIHYSTLMKSNKSSFDNNSIPNETMTSMLNSNNSSTEHMNKNDYSQLFYMSYVVTIVKYLAAIGVILITIKFSFSFIRWYSKKPIDDDMNSCFIKTDNESTCNMELKSHHS